MTSGESFAGVQEILAGDYLLEAEIGRGGMGVVYRAHDNRYERTVAIKTILQQQLSVLASRAEEIAAELERH